MIPCLVYFSQQHIHLVHPRRVEAPAYDLGEGAGQEEIEQDQNRRRN